MNLTHVLGLSIPKSSFKHTLQSLKTIREIVYICRITKDWSNCIKYNCHMTTQMSIAQYAKKIGKNPETVRLWIVNDRLPKGVGAKKVGNYYVITYQAV